MATLRISAEFVLESLADGEHDVGRYKVTGGIPPLSRVMAVGFDLLREEIMIEIDGPDLPVCRPKIERIQ